MEHKDLLDRLNEYAAQDYVPMHMPGAKRNTELFAAFNPYGLDITEIDNFDNMHHADGIIKAAFERCAHTFGAEESLYLVNGSSAGILAAICGATGKGDKVIAARNSHISVYNAIYLNELEPIYVYPEYIDEEAGICAGITAAQVENVFENGVKAVIITSPTYEGMVSDIEAIAELAHKNGAVLIVDEAHGAHFNFDEAFPRSAVKCGADLVVQSLHKTLPSFTQTAVLHMCGGLVDRKRVKMYWDMYQSTSPSYLLMAGIDRCVTILNESGKELFKIYIRRLKKLRERLAGLKNFRLLDTDDISKLVIITDDGRKLYDILLRQYYIQLEMFSLKYVIAMTSIGDKEPYYDSFVKAMEKIDESWSCENEITEGNCGNEISERNGENEVGVGNGRNEAAIGNDGNKSAERNGDKKSMLPFCTESIASAVSTASAMDTGNIASISGTENAVTTSGKESTKVSIYEALNSESEQIGLSMSEGRTAAVQVCFYPPGVPLIVPGEIIGKEHIRIIEEGLRAGLEVIGIEQQHAKKEEVTILCLR